jgi:hypothetical protein
MIGNLLLGTQDVLKFFPTSLPNLKLWLDASDTSTITVSGTAVTQWVDKSGNSYAFTQGTSTYRPQSGTRTQNGLNVLDFNGDDILNSTASASTWNFLHNGNLHTIFIAYKRDVNNTVQYMMDTANASSSNIGAQVGGNSNNALFHSVVRGVTGASAVNNVTANSSLGTNFDYLSILADPNNGTAANRSDIRFKQGSAIKNNTLTAAVSASNATDTLAIGDFQAGNNTGIDGMIGEIIIYTSLLSAGDLLKVQQYLAAKWGV